MQHYQHGGKNLTVHSTRATVVGRPPPVLVGQALLPVRACYGDIVPGQTRLSVLPSNLTTTQTTGPSACNTFLLGRRHVVSLRNFGSKCDSLAHRTLRLGRTRQLAPPAARGRQRLRSARWRNR